MIVSFNGKTPKIAPSAFISKMACIIGDVEIGEHSSVWPGAVIRGDFGRIVIGDNSLVEDNVVIHGEEVNIGNFVTIGHGAVVEARKLGDNVLIGNGAVVLLNVDIGDYCIVGANAVVKEGTTVPARSLVAGIPAEIKGDITPERERILESFRYPPELIAKYKEENEL